MIKLEKKHVDYLKQYIPNVEKLLKGDIDELLTAINIAIVTHGIDEDDEPNAIGDELQKIYDHIYVDLL